MEKQIKISPFTRVEGDLEIDITVKDGRVAGTRTSGTLFRNFENILRGREPEDAVVFLCRICGTCGATHSSAASAAIRHAYGSAMPPNAAICENIICSIEMIMSHLAHFYFSFAVDFYAPKYGPEAERRFKPFEGGSYRRALAARKNLTPIMGLFAGKWPNTLAIQPGGCTKSVSSSEIYRATGVLGEFERFLEDRMLGGPVDEWLRVSTVKEMEKWFAKPAARESDVGLFHSLSFANGLHKIGAGLNAYLSSGCPWAPAGFMDNGKIHPFDSKKITESAEYSFFKSDGEKRHPFEGVSDVNPDKKEAYSWCKAPRYGGRSVEVGPLARLMVAGNPLISDIHGKYGKSVFLRIIARIQEIFILSKLIREWMGELNGDEPFYIEPARKKEASGEGVVEAPRGTLGHWIKIEDGKIKNYQVITPTGWNFSPSDSSGSKGPLEEALAGSEVGGDDDLINITHIVRSFDPCLFCAVH
jgi:hydrogenase large subunit